MRPALWIILAVTLAGSLTGCGKAVRPAAAATTPVTELYFGDPATEQRLVRGVSRVGDLMWAQRLFSVRLDRPEPLLPTPLYVELDFAIPGEMKIGEMVQDLTLTARVNGIEACRETLRTSGRKHLACVVPVAALDQPTLVFEYESNRSYRDWETGAERALVLAGVRLLPYEATEEFHALQVKRARSAEDEAVREWDKYPPERRRRLRQIMEGLPAWNNTRFLGVPVGKNPTDLWMVQQLIHEVRPDFVVTTRAEQGGAALFYAQTLEGLGGGGKVVVIGEGGAPYAAAEKRLWKDRVEFVTGAGPAKEKVGGAKTLVVLASSATPPDLKTYAPMVSSGSYLIVEDAGRNPAVAAAVQAFLTAGGSRDFELDRRPEALLIGFHNGGWLRRK